MKLVETPTIPIRTWLEGLTVEPDAWKQIYQTTAALSQFMPGPMAVMPDAHLGMGATVGTVIPMVGAIAPSVVGVDLYCGMNYCVTDIKAEQLENLNKILELLTKYIPNGRTNEGQKGDWGAWNDVPPHVAQVWKDRLEAHFKTIVLKHPKVIGSNLNNINHLGTLGTGNHFVEITIDEQNRVGILLHSGSRGIGNALARYFITEAKEEMLRKGIDLPDKDLAYLTEDQQAFRDYVEAFEWAAEYATASRELMMDAAFRALSEGLGLPVNKVGTQISCHHNYISREVFYNQDVWLIRKGAVSAKKDQLGIIPGAMGAKSYIVRGKGNEASYMSCSHGAGRSMSRTEAKRRFTLEDHLERTKNLVCLKDDSLIDEIVDAYKDLDVVMKAQEDLVDIQHTLKAVITMKGPEDKNSKRNRKKNKG